MLGSLIYTLPQKKGNLQEPAFLLGKSVAVSLILTIGGQGIIPDVTFGVSWMEGSMG